MTLRISSPPSVCWNPTSSPARQPARVYGAPLAEDASNLADALMNVRELSFQAFADVRERPSTLPTRPRWHHLRHRGRRNAIHRRPSSKNGASHARSTLSMPRSVPSGCCPCSRSSHHPSPPPFVAIEEVDHGMHPYALEVLVDALRAASERTQILIATHSPTFVNRLKPDELVICDRDPETGVFAHPRRRLRSGGRGRRCRRHATRESSGSREPSVECPSDGGQDHRVRRGPERYKRASRADPRPVPAAVAQRREGAAAIPRRSSVPLTWARSEGGLTGRLQP